MSVLAAVPRERLMNGSRTNSLSVEDENRERAELETAFPRCVIIHFEQFLYVRLSVETADVMQLSARVAASPASPRSLEQERATLLRLRKAPYNNDVKFHCHPVCSSTFTCVRSTQSIAGRSWVCLPSASGNNPNMSPSSFRLSLQKQQHAFGIMALSRDGELDPRRVAKRATSKVRVATIVDAFGQRLQWLSWKRRQPWLAQPRFRIAVQRVSGV
jgi:hypothetical protein